MQEYCRAGLKFFGHEKWTRNNPLQLFSHIYIFLKQHSREPWLNINNLHTCILPIWLDFIQNAFLRCSKEHLSAKQTTDWHGALGISVAAAVTFAELLNIQNLLGYVCFWTTQANGVCITASANGSSLNLRDRFILPLLSTTFFFKLQTWMQQLHSRINVAFNH